MLKVTEMYLRDKKSDIPGTPGTVGCDTRTPGPFHGHGRAVRSLRVCQNGPDSIGRHEVCPSRVTRERMGRQLMFRGLGQRYPTAGGAY